jgi:hypothetical protein
VEAGGDAVGDFYAGDRRGGKIRGVKEGEFGGFGRGVDDQAHQDAVILG